MRPAPLVVILLLASPFVGALSVPSMAPTIVAPLPDDLSDADLVRLLARADGITLGATPTLMIPRDADVASLVLKLGARAGLEPATADVAPFLTLDPRVVAPTIAMLAAVDQAWDMRDQAFARLTRAQQLELYDLITARAPGEAASAREAALAASVDKRTLFTAAILLLDTIDQIVTPAVEDAVAAGAWPAAGAWDSVGVLRLGSTGNDLEFTNRIVQLDPMGNDVYRNNAGGASILSQISPTNVYNVAISLDFAGNDVYNKTSRFYVQGAGSLGIGILRDFSGADAYRCDERCHGAGGSGVGYFRDDKGDDLHEVGAYGGGSGTTGLGVSREDEGSDTYRMGGGGGSSDGDDGTGLAWDRAGRDNYTYLPGSYGAYGWSHGGRGWFVDEGPNLDYYQQAFAFPHGCNDCTWLAGVAGDVGSANGRGNDNMGGLAALLGEDDVFYRP